MAKPNIFVFNEAYYLSLNPDVAYAVRAGVFASGLTHWQLYGSAEGRSASQFFDWQIYRDNNPDLVDAGLVTQADFIRHFNLYGVNEPRIFLNTRLFDYKYYADHNPDLAAAGIVSRLDLEMHFKNSGVYEGRIASSFVNGISYVNQNPDLKALLEAGGNISGFTLAEKDKAGIFHYYNWGISEGRSLGAPRVDDPFPAAAQSTPVWVTDTNADGIYNAGDVIHIKFSEPVSISQSLNLKLGSGKSLALTTLSPVDSSGGYASEFQILLNAGANITANDVVIALRQSVVDQSGQKATGDIYFALPKLPQPAPALPAFSLSIDIFGDLVVNALETSSMTGIDAIVTSSSLASLVVSGLHNGSAHQETAVWNSSTERYEFDATQFDDGALTVLARDIYGQTQSFSVTKDATAPTLSGASPQVAAMGIAPNANIVLTFSENVQLGSSGSLSLYQVTGGPAVETFNVATDLSGKVSVSNNELTINPSANLLSDMGYYLLIDSGAIVDSSGNAYVGISSPSTYYFTIRGADIVGSSGGESITGTSSYEVINALGGNDTIDSGAGGDTVTGGSGADVFVYTDVSNWSSTETITDFANTALNTVQLSDGLLSNINGDVFLVDLSELAAISGYVALNTSVASGVSTLVAGDWVIGGSADQAHAQFILAGNDTLLFDPDGTGSTAPITIVGHYTYTWLTGTMIAIQA
jgi:Ca2+-binding RTX toxin-like protein